MVVERPSQKSLRLTAIDSEGHVKIFLAMVSEKVEKPFNLNVIPHVLFLNFDLLNSDFL